MTAVTADSIWGHIEPEPNSGCWLWIGHDDGHKGYGRVETPDGPRTQAHRAAWMAFVGPIPDGLFVLHRCDNTRCVNPGHLFLGKSIDNVRDCIAKGRFRYLGPSRHNALKTHCPAGHPYSGDNLVLGRSRRHCRVCRNASFRAYWKRRRAREVAIMRSDT